MGRRADTAKRHDSTTYLPHRQNQRFGAINFYVRSSGAAEPLLSTVARLMAGADRALPLENLRTMDAQVRAAAESDRSLTTLAAAFALLAVVLTAVGLYGVLSYSVAQRRREIGLRIVLGADAWRITRLVFGHVGRVALAGGIAGSIAAIGVGRLAQSMLFGVEVADFGVIAGAAVIMTIFATAAAAPSVRRAARIDPALTLRAD